MKNRTHPHRPRISLPVPSRLTRALVAALIAAFPAAPLYALPTDGQVTAGSATIQQAGSTLTVNQATERAAINWQSFGIAANEAVRFNQPSASSIVLNRVLGQDPSRILGSLSANGQVFLLNPNGVLFGAGAQVDVGGIVASTLQLSDADFLAGRYTFAKGATAGPVINQGTITAADGGYVALLAPQVRNEGVISATLGSVALAAGNQVTVNLNGTSLVSLAVDQGAVDPLVENRQLVRADGGQVLMTAKAADALIRSVVNNEGIVEASTLTSVNGVIRLEGGLVQQSGTLRADGGPATAAGQVLLKAGSGVTLEENSLTSASGSRGGNVTVQTETGTIRVAGRIDASGTDVAGAINLTVTGSSGGVDLPNGLNAGKAAINISGPGSTITLANDMVTAGVGISINDSVILGAPDTITLDTTNGGAVPGGASIVITGTINDDATPTSLVLRSGTIGGVSLMGAVGDAVPIQGLTVALANFVRLPAVNTREGGLSVTTQEVFAGAFTRLGGNINTTHGPTGAGNVSFSGHVRLGTNVGITTDHATGTDGNVSFGATSTVNPDQLDGWPAVTLTVNAGAGDVNFGGAIGRQTAGCGGGSPTQCALQGLVVASADDVRLNALSTRGGVQVVAAGDVELNGGITAGGAGDAIVLAAGNNFINHAGAGALSAPAGRWLVFSTRPASDQRGGLVPGFKQYNASFGDAVLGAGNGFLYSFAPFVTAELTGTVSKTYDGTTAASLAPENYVVNGAIDGDTVLINNPAAGNYADRHVGTNKNVSVTGIEIVSAANNGMPVFGYRLAADGASGNVGEITPATLTARADDKARVYGEANPALTVSLSGFVPGEDASVLGALPVAATEAVQNSNVGNYTITVAGGAAANYTFAYENGTLTITKAPLTITADDKTMTQGSPVPELTATFTGLKAGDTPAVVTGLEISTTGTSSSAPGAYPITPCCGVATNYDITFVNGTLTINASGPVLPPHIQKLVAHLNQVAALLDKLRARNAANVLRGVIERITDHFLNHPKAGGLHGHSGLPAALEHHVRHYAPAFLAPPKPEPGKK